MNVVYLAYSKGIEKEILKAYLNHSDGSIVIGESVLAMPIIVNVTPEDIEDLKQLGVSVYKWVTEFRTVRNPTEAALDRFGFRIQRIAKAAKKSDMDILVIYDAEENIDLIRDELKRWIRTTK